MARVNKVSQAAEALVGVVDAIGSIEDTARLISEVDIDAIYNDTPVCHILNFLNRKCVDAAKSEQQDLAEQYAELSTRVEAALYLFITR